MPGWTFINALEYDPFIEDPGAATCLLGCDNESAPYFYDLCKAPNILISGPSGTGKSTLAHAIILSIIRKYAPENCRLLLCDTKVVEFSFYKGCPHLLVPPVTELNRFCGAFQWLKAETERRLSVMRQNGFRDVESFNSAARENNKDAFPRIITVVDDGSSLPSDCRAPLDYVVANGRTAGIHLVMVAQNPSDKFLSIMIKNAFHLRVVTGIQSKADAKLLLDDQNQKPNPGPECITLYHSGTGKSIALNTFQITDTDISTTVSTSCRVYGNQPVFEAVAGTIPHPNYGKLENEYGDPLLADAVEVVMDTKQASVSMLQRRLKLGYAHAARIVDEMEEKGIVGPFEGSKPRQLLITQDQWNHMVGVNPKATQYNVEVSDSTNSPDETDKSTKHMREYSDSQTNNTNPQKRKESFKDKIWSALEKYADHITRNDDK